MRHGSVPRTVADAPQARRQLPPSAGPPGPGSSAEHPAGGLPLAPRCPLQLTAVAHDDALLGLPGGRCSAVGAGASRGPQGSAGACASAQGSPQRGLLSVRSDTVPPTAKAPGPAGDAGEVLAEVGRDENPP